MSLAGGSRLGPYEIAALIGAGGMGEVYRARDTRLDRTVAIKVLSGLIGAQPGMRDRFEREARIISRISHPHICSLFDVGHEAGTDYLVLEYLEGETLAHRLEKGPLPLDQGIELGEQIAAALAKAHGAGVVHRDLKPGNIMLTKSGAKLLDFGLAKPVAAVQAGGGATAIPTASTSLTASGSILGTLPYMAPEQVEGREADVRSDIWALGCVLYETMTGRRAFEANSQASLIAAILEHQPPPVRSLQPLVLPALDRLVQRALAKDPDRRWQSAADLGIALQCIAGAEPAPPSSGASARAVRAARAGTVAAAIVAMVSLAIAVWLVRREGTAVLPAEQPARFTLAAQVARLAGDPIPSVAVSRDGQRIVYAGGAVGTARLVLRELSSGAETSINGTEGGTAPFFSPDGQWLGFFANSRLKKISLDGGAPVDLAPVTNVRGAVWAPDDTIIFCPTTGTGLLRIATSGGSPQVIASPDVSKRERSYRWPSLLPDGKTILFTIARSDILSFDDARIAVRSLQGGEQREILQGGSFATYVPTGHIVYARAGAILAVPFDLKGLRVTGPPTAVLDRVTNYPVNGSAEFAVAPDGTLVFAPGGPWSSERTLSWVDRSGHEVALPAPVLSYQGVRISPDGRIAALDIDGANANIWTYEFVRNALTRFTLEWNNNAPVWSPDGSQVAFTSARGGPANIWIQSVDGRGEPEQLARSQYQQAQGSWSPDAARYVYSEQHPSTGLDLWVVSLRGGREPRAFLQTRFDETSPVFSPDGRWIAYVSNETGRNEVYLLPYPGPGRKWSVSSGEGRAPAWAHDGSELYYLSGDAVMAVPIQTRPSFAPATARVLFRRASMAAVAVARQGRFLVIDNKPAGTFSIDVLLNWFTDLKRRVVH